MSDTSRATEPVEVDLSALRSLTSTHPDGFSATAAAAGMLDGDLLDVLLGSRPVTGGEVLGLADALGVDPRELSSDRMFAAPRVPLPDVLCATFDPEQGQLWLWGWESEYDLLNSLRVLALADPEPVPRPVGTLDGSGRDDEVPAVEVSAPLAQFVLWDAGLADSLPQSHGCPWYLDEPWAPAEQVADDLVRVFSMCGGPGGFEPETLDQLMLSAPAEALLRELAEERRIQEQGTAPARAVVRLVETPGTSPFTGELLVGPTDQPALLRSVAAAAEGGFLSQVKAGRAARGSVANATGVLLADQGPVVLSAEDVDALLVAELQLSDAGVGLQMPAPLRRARPVDSTVAFEEIESRGSGLLPQLRLAAKVSVDGRELSPDEVARLLASAAGLVPLGDGWVRVAAADRERVAALARATSQEGTVAPARAVAHALAGELDTDEGPVAVRDSTLRQRLVERASSVDLAAPPAIDNVALPLLAHQQVGASWLQQMADRGWGTLLADDMGVGKTAQAIALLASRPGPHLVVAPLAMLDTWRVELDRFLADPKVVVYHGPDRPRTIRPSQDEVVVTTYERVGSDVAMLSGVSWDTVVLDEATRVKNPRTKAAAAVKALPCEARVALTGTPVENSLTDLWAIFDFLNPGLFGSLAGFRRRIVTPVEAGDVEVAQRLQRILGPFQLRRTKQEADLDVEEPEVIDVACTLTPEQALMYTRDQSRAEDGFGASENGRAMHVLTLLTRLKQVCNHPEQRLRQGGPVAGRSGKLARCEELVTGAVADGRKVLVFTQFTVMADLLAERLGQLLGVEVPVYSGRLATRQRNALVREFQGEGGPPVMVMSTKAGNVGLTLTAASVVVHYDLLWNPAAEDQATGRACRYGQTRQVTVYRLMVDGTLEERIGQLLETKRQFAEVAYGAEARLLSSLTDEELAELTALSATALDDHTEVAA